MKTLSSKVILALAAVVIFGMTQTASAQRLQIQLGRGGVKAHLVDNARLVDNDRGRDEGRVGRRPALIEDDRQRLVRPRLVEPQPQLPSFGFSSFNIRGYGERVTHVAWHGIAGRLGLERGDTILAVNHVRLTYPGAWERALADAMQYHHGDVRLTIRDVRSGRIAYRSVNLFGHDRHDHDHGPITPKTARR